MSGAAMETAEQGAIPGPVAPRADPPLAAVVGLGNPGRRYEHTRHNIGFMVADALARRLGAGAWREEQRALVCRANLEGRSLLVIKPQTFMNLSGQAVRALANRHRLAAASLLVVNDDLDLPFGRLRLRTGGSPGGHNGLRSIIAELGTQDFPRLRVGIGRPAEGDPIEWVLAPFEPAERSDLGIIVEAAVDAVLLVASQGMRAAMNAINGRADVRKPQPESAPRRAAGMALPAAEEQAGV